MSPAELTSIAALHARLEPRISLGGRRLRSTSTATLSPVSATPAAMSSLRLRGLRSLHRLAMRSSVCYRMARTLPRPVGGSGRAARSEPLGKELLERLAADRVVHGQVITTA